MPDAAREVDHDDGFMAIANPSLGLGGKELWEGEGAYRTDFQKLSA